jgi:hypothetical protein
MQQLSLCSENKKAFSQINSKNDNINLCNSNNPIFLKSLSMKVNNDPAFINKDDNNNNKLPNKNKELNKGTLKIVKKGYNSYNCQNFFFAENLKFWTYNSEIIKIVDFFGFSTKGNSIKNNISNNNNEENKISKSLSMKEGILNNGSKNIDLYDGLNVHFVDACLSLSKFITSKKHSIFHDSLREKVVNKITKQMWEKKFKLKGEDFESKKKNFLSEKLSLRILESIKPKLKNLLENARRNIYLKKINNGQ